MSKFLIPFLVLLPFFIIGQQQYHVTNYGPSKGMSEGPKMHVVQDSIGFLWINSSSGINRFDGKHFKVYSGDPSDSTTFSNPEMFASCVTDKGDLYMVGKEGLFLYNRKEDKFTSCMSGYITYHTESSNEFTKLIQVENSLYITSYIGLHEYNMLTKVWSYYNLTPDIVHKNNHHSPKSNRAIIRDKYNPEVLIIGGRMLVHRFDTQDKKVIETYPLQKYKQFRYQIHNITQTSKTEYLLSTWGAGTLRFDMNKKKEDQMYVYDDLILDVGPYMINLDLEYINDTTLLIVNKSGYPLIYNLVDNTWSKLKLEDLGMKHSSVFKDRDGNLWLTNNDMLSKVSPSPFEELKFEELKSRPIYWAIPDSKGEKVIFFIGGESAYSNSFSEIENNTITPIEGPKWKITHDSYANQYIYPKDKEKLTILDSELNKKEYISLEHGTNYAFLLPNPDEYLVSYHDKIVVYNKDGKQVQTYNIQSEKIKRYSYPMIRPCHWG